MFRSVFTKYITAFSLIILISFTILASIICSMVSDQLTDTKAELVRHSATAACSYFDVGFADSGSTDFPSYIADHEKTSGDYLTRLIENSGDLLILLTDTEGNILVTDRGSREYRGQTIPREFTDAALAGGAGAPEKDSTLGGLLPAPHMVYAEPVTGADDAADGVLYVCASSDTVAALLESMLKAIIMATLWVLLAALIAVYFISERISGPLKEMTRAARSFGKGQFDVRVPVTGNDEVAELATAFNNMASSLATVEHTRSTFLANVSHDLRTPMTTIAGFVDNMIDDIIPPDKMKYYLGIISAEVKRLSRLVSSLLDISRIQAGERKFTKEPFDICEMARQILISFENKIDAKKLDVEFECDDDNMTVLADRDAIYQVLYNICDNAVKFSREGGRYRITITAKGMKDKKVHVTVFNEGQGIPPDDLPHIFDRFYKSDRSRGLDKTGVGLGMYIARTIMEAHGEKIWVDSVYGENCEFGFTLTKEK